MTILSISKQDVQDISDVQKTDLNLNNAAQTTSVNGNVDAAETAILNALTAKATAGDVTAARDSVNANVDACESAVLSAISGVSGGSTPPGGSTSFLYWQPGHPNGSWTGSAAQFAGMVILSDGTIRRLDTSSTGYTSSPWGSLAGAPAVAYTRTA